MVLLELALVVLLSANDEQCAAIERDDVRLACYDRIAKLKPSRTGIGKWKIDESFDEITDAKITTLTTSARGNGPLSKPFLVIRCIDHSMDLFVGWNEYLGPNQPRVTSRVEGYQPVTAPWGISADNTASFYPYDVIELLKRLIKTKKFVVRATPYNESPRTAVFDLERLESAVKPIRQHCAW